MRSKQGGEKNNIVCAKMGQNYVKLSFPMVQYDVLSQILNRYLCTLSMPEGEGADKAKGSFRNWADSAVIRHFSVCI